MVSEGITQKREALEAIDVDDIRQLLSLDVGEGASEIATGTPAGRECIIGKLCLTPEQVLEAKKAGEKSVFVKNAITSADLEVILNASAVVTTSGTSLSLGAALLRLLRRTAALGCRDLVVDYTEAKISSKGTSVSVGELVTVTGDGRVVAGEAPTVTPKLIANGDAIQILRWADEVRQGKIAVYTTATTADDVKFAVDIESDGIGTFPIATLIGDETDAVLKGLATGFTEELISTFEEQLTVALEPILQNTKAKTITFELYVPNFRKYFPCPLQIAREIGVLKAKAAKAEQPVEEGEPPRAPFEEQQLLDEKIAELEKLKKTQAVDPALGCVGVRHCLVHTDFFGAQYRAIAFAAKGAKGKGSFPKIRLIAPLVAHDGELQRFSKVLETEVQQFGEAVSVGALLQTPRACLTAGKIAGVGTFVVVSVPKLTEFTYASVAEEAEQTWLKAYRDRGIFRNDIFGKAEPSSVGVLMNKAIKGARDAVPAGEVGIYNEEFGNPGTDLLNQYITLGVNGIICKPLSVPIARLTAAKSLLVGK
jgi:pyruvate,orthophosphate dikinase